MSLDIRKLPSGKRNLYRIELSSEEECREYTGSGVERNRPARVCDREKGELTEDTGAEGAGDCFSRVWRETADWEKPGFQESLLEYSCCRRAFIRGAFLASGSMSDPGKSYHFEIVCRMQRRAEELCAVIESFDIHPKIIQRKNKPVVYLKDSESIVDILNVMGAGGALMRLENVRIIKGMKNSANRQSNCDSANINKIVRAAVRQVEDIRLIEQKMGFSQLPPMLREMALVRLEHPEESLQELGTYLNPPVGKSGVNHRLKKLSEIAETLR
ncbi:MAG: DNA-binding protein WhiA [Clostridiales bacterium]|nr:DNA-binding protein WhiA [Clostridiales bacterium]